MLDDPLKSTKRVLEPYDRISEVLFGVIMVLTCTGSLSVAGADRAEVRTMLIGALGCNLAWGIIDAALYLMGRQKPIFWPQGPPSPAPNCRNGLKSANACGSKPKHLVPPPDQSCELEILLR